MSDYDKEMERIKPFVIELRQLVHKHRIRLRMRVDDDCVFADVRASVGSACSVSLVDTDQEGVLQ
jgi:hypothetical protein